MVCLPRKKKDSVGQEFIKCSLLFKIRFVLQVKLSSLLFQRCNMLKVIRERGFADGLKAGRKKKQESLGLSIKQLVNLVFVKDDREIAKQFMKEYGICRTKAFKFALKYVSEFDHGVRESTYSIGD